MVALDNLDLAILNIGGTGKSVCQCRQATIKTTRAVPMQVDGEPCMMQPCTITIKQDQTVAKTARMLVRNKSASCEYYLLLWVHSGKRILLERQFFP